MRLLSTCALLLGLAACSAEPGQAAPPSVVAGPSVHAESGLPVVALTVVHGAQRHVFRVEVARTGPEQARGLMFRTAMDADAGMIFPFKPPRAASFWMRNTLIPLDILFVGPDGRVTNIAANAIPHDETPLSSDGLAMAVLELNGGRAAQLGIAPGDKVEW